MRMDIILLLRTLFAYQIEFNTNEYSFNTHTICLYAKSNLMRMNIILLHVQ